MTRKDITTKLLNQLEVMDFTVLPDQLDTDYKALGMDSMEFVEWWMSVETVFNVIITDPEAAEVKTVNDMVTLIMKKKNAIAV